MTNSDVWDETTARRYDADCAHLASAEHLAPCLDFLAGYAGDGWALEFAIGTGRVAVPLAERVAGVAGVELSPAMLAELRAKPVGAELPVVLDDMATATVAQTNGASIGPGGFSLVYLVFNTVMNLLSQDAQVSCFQNAARHLRPGGHFVVECMVPELRRLPPGQLACPFEVTDAHLGFDTYDLVHQRLVSHHFRPESEGRFSRFASRHRYVWPSELDLMARLAGMRLVERVEGWSKAPFTDDSESHVSVWQLQAVARG